MFTNWLTGTTGGGSATNQNLNENRTGPPNLMPPNSNGNGGNGHILMSTPPDVILEIGSVPSVVRFVAHSIVLGMHSGYLRSAIRLDERTSSSSSSQQPDFVLYLGNVTAEQFAPLLTYMYTGYLDLNVENIFGVLLATHVLHMPRALEICRAFLARAQTEGYLGARMNSLNNGNICNGNGKIIRPIPSKPALPNFGFLSTLPPQLAQQQQLLSQGQLLVNFKALQRSNENGCYPSSPSSVQICDQPERTTQQQQQRATSEEIDVDQESIHASLSVGDESQKNTIKYNDADDDDEDEEVFIDSSNTDTDNDDSEVIIECRNKSSEKREQKHPELPKSDKKVKEKITKKLDNHSNKSTKQPNRNTNSNYIAGSITSSSGTNTKARYDKRRTASKLRSSSGLQIAKAPIPASQLDVNEGSKVIIDVASCDGPVRFRRILNTAYGHKPDDFGPQIPERSQQSVSYSFHQQMARTINQQRQQMQQQSGGEESENSESSGSSKKATINANAPTEIYVCVYCKHTFKSQYCYQKHAKRHLNPLSLNSAERCGEKSTLNAGLYTTSSLSSCSGTIPIALSANKPNATDLLRREVRPLDMNVQYYPCKTCGSKFPSYYFVHKHRKLCHADEEAASQGKDNSVQQNESDNAASLDVDNQKEEEKPTQQQPQEELNDDNDIKKGNESDSKIHEN